LDIVQFDSNQYLLDIIEADLVGTPVIELHRAVAAASDLVNGLKTFVFV
tara:strand:- start:492 stop:638 length:147 start_codon:yes stop_codon:yes gene_type:complete